MIFAKVFMGHCKGVGRKAGHVTLKGGFHLWSLRAAIDTGSRVSFMSLYS
jgi:hypothetical protein